MPKCCGMSAEAEMCKRYRKEIGMNVTYLEKAPAGVLFRLDDVLCNFERENLHIFLSQCRCTA